ncbi:MAG: hypothetical protein SNJ55_06610 [Chloroherpetonaceae bacterium]
MNTRIIHLIRVPFFKPEHRLSGFLDCGLNLTPTLSQRKGNSLVMGETGINKK